MRRMIALNLAQIDDTERANTLTAIQSGAKTSALAQQPAIATALLTLANKGATLAGAVTAAAAAEQQILATRTARDQARIAFDRSLVALKSLVEDAAQTPSDVTSLGFTAAAAMKSSKAAPEPPGPAVVSSTRTHGKVQVSVPQADPGPAFVAESALAPADPSAPLAWTSLPGTGRRRTLTGLTSGTKLWVHFATVRYGMQSAWSTPVLVTVP